MLRRGAGAMLVCLVAMVCGGCQMYRLCEAPRYQRLVFAAEAPRLRVLFVGNSLTYYNDLPGLVQQFSAREARPVEFEVVTKPGVSLWFHWAMCYVPWRMRRAEWDYVILQEYSRKPATNPEGSLASLGKFAELATRRGAVPIYWETWTRQGCEKDAPKLAAVFAAVQARWGGELAPIGAAWERCAARFPAIKLYDDARHPTDAGSYLAACVIYETLYHKSAAGLPVALPGLRLPAETAAQLQQVAAMEAVSAGAGPG